MEQKRIDEIKTRCEAATPGPWRWYVNEHAKSIRLVTDHSGQYYVMGFERYGMHGAQPTFQTYQKYDGPVSERGSKGMVKASEMSKWDQDYRHDDGWVEHPDAQFIAHAPQDIADLLAEVERLNEALEAKEAVNRAYSVTLDMKQIEIERLRAERDAAMSDNQTPKESIGYKAAKGSGAKGKYYELQTASTIGKPGIYHNVFLSESELKLDKWGKYIERLKSGDYCERLVHLREISEHEYEKFTSQMNIQSARIRRKGNRLILTKLR